MSQKYSNNKWYKRKYHDEYVKLIYVLSFDNIKGHGYTLGNKRLWRDSGWVTDIDFLHEQYKEIDNEITQTLELLYE